MPPPTLDTRPVILVVDDTPDNLNLMHALLRDIYRVKLASSGERALRLARTEPLPDLVLLDIMMPGMDGYEVCKQLQAEPFPRRLPVLFLTAKSTMEDEEYGLSLGAVDYITKPISPPIVLARIKAHLQVKRAADILHDQNAWLAREVARRTRQIENIQDVTIFALASLAETRDNETGNHIRRTQHYVRTLARVLQGQPGFAELNDESIELLFKSAPLHDIGKVGIPDSILLKPAKLTAEEFEVMKTHTTLGHDAIVMAESMLESPADFLRYAKEIAWCHQEKWDGSGYPRGLKGTEIPVSARLMALADVYDALISARVYKPAFSKEVAAQILREGRGRHFDPAVVDAFDLVEQQFSAIADRFADP